MMESKVLWPEMLNPMSSSIGNNFCLNFKGIRCVRMENEGKNTHFWPLRICTSKKHIFATVITLK